MLRPRIIDRYLLTEMLAPFFVSLLVCTCALLLAKVMELTELVVDRGVGLDVVGLLLLYTLPYFLVFTVPMGTLLGVLLAFLRLSADNEITALRSAGVSLAQLLPPVAVLAVGAWLLTGVLAIWALPWGHYQFETLVFRVAKSRADLALKERVFLDSFPGLMIYINRLPGEGVMEHVFIVDQRDPQRVQTIVANRGKLFPARDQRITIRLYEGTIHGVDQDLAVARNATFQTYDISLDAGHLGAGRRGEKHRKEMSLAELNAALDAAPPDSREHRLLDMELQQRFAYPGACLVMALIGIPLGTHWRSGRSWGVLAALAVFLAYYLMISAAWSLSETGMYPPKVGVWMPNVVVGLVGVVLFRREARGRPFPVLDSAGANLGTLGQRLLSRLRS
jgi:lipopolysaccharide export system permease protein